MYGDIDENAADDAVKKTLNAVSDVAFSSRLLEKCTKDDVDGLQAYTIRRMDEKLPVGLDCEHYKMMTIQENALDSRNCHLDVLCFLILFPTGQFGQYHPRQIKIQFSEYVKC